MKIQPVQAPSTMQQMVFSRTTDGSTTITKSLHTDDETEPWGDSLIVKDDSTIRIVSKQIGGLGITVGNSKERELKNWIIENEIDCIGLQETNVFWKKCNDKSQFRERMRHHKWDFVRTSTAFNKHEFTAFNQFGGAAIVTTNVVASRVCCTGADETGLGRWAWVQYRGKNKTSARVISVYQPHKPADETLHPKSVYRQQQRYWMNKKSDMCPLTHFQDDLCMLLQKWIRNHERIVLLIDANESTIDGPLRLRLERIGLVSAYKVKFGTGTRPATYHRGKEMIDDIFITKNFRLERAGMFAFGDGPGDHRGLYVDINLDSFMGSDEYIVQRIQARRLISNNPIVTEKFNRLFESQLQRHHLHERIDELYRTFSVPMTQEYIDTYEKLDRIQVSAFAYANKRCRKLRCGDVPSSDILNYFGSLIRLWTYVIRKKRGCKVSSKMIARLAAACDISKPMSVSVALANEWRAQAWKDYNSVKDDPDPAREDYLNRLYEKIAEEEGVEKAEVILKKKQQEETRNAHRRIKFARHKENSGGTMKLEVDNPNGPGTIEITDKTEMEKVLMKTNEAKFRLASSTPLAHGQLLEELGPCGMTRDAERVLKGTYVPPPNIHLGAKTFLANVCMSHAIIAAPPISAAIIADEHSHFWRSQRESTQSSPSGLHFGYMKTTAKIPRLAETISKFVSIPYESGYSPDRWRNSINVTLMKEEGQFRPEKQRTIHLLESSFSEGCKVIFSRRMMQHARKYGQIPSDQYARKGGKSIDAALQKILTFDLMRMQKRAGVCFANDLMANYDRMAHLPSGLALRFLGAPPTAVQCMSSTMQNMRHYIRTAYGDSETFYGGDPDRPLQGGGQGSPAAPPMWIALTIIVLRMLSTYEPGVTVLSAISTAILTFSAILYVDDTDLFVLQKEDETVEEMLQRAQTLTSRWVEAMWATGAALRPEKCWWCLVDFTWEGSRWRYQFYDETDAILQVRDDDGIYQQIKRVDVREGNKGLGLRFSADGDMTMELEYLKKASEQWAADIQNSFLDKKTSALALTSTIFGTWAYPSSATNFTRKQSELLVKPVFKVVLPKIGVNRHLPKTYRYASLSHHGLASQDYFVNQGVDHIVKMLAHIAKHTYVGGLLEAILELAALEIGSGTNIFHLDYERYSGLLTDSWIKIPWRCCSDHKIYVNGRYHLPKLARVNDKFLMEMAVSSELLTKKELQIVNRCRLFLRILCLSDLCSGDGKRVVRCYYDGAVDPHRESCLAWPSQARPTKTEWKIWQRCVTTVWAPLPGMSLTEPLGVWTRHSHQHWRWFFLNDVLYFNNDQGHFDVYNKSIFASRRSQSRLYFPTGEVVDEISPSVQAATVHSYNQGCVLFEGAASFCCVSDDDHDEHRHEQRIVSHLLSSGRWLRDGEALVDAIRKKEAICVSDGSFHPEFLIGTAGYVFDDGHNSVIGIGGHRVPGPDSSQCSYRSELFGLYLSLLTIKILCAKYDVQSGKITIGCDNIGALDKGLQAQFFPSIQHKHHDLIWAIHSLRHEIPIEIGFRHVQGHQDKKSNKPLDRWAQLNLLADAEAKRHLSWYIQNSSHDHDLSFVTPHWSVRVNGDTVTQDIRRTLQNYIHNNEMKKFLIRKGVLTSLTYDCVDWKSNGTAMRALSFSERTWVTKHVSGFCGCGKMMERCKQWETSACPRCGDCVEDNWHVLWCNETVARSMRHKLTQAVDTWLIENNTHPALHLLIVKVFQRGDSVSFSSCARENLDPSITALASEQDQIGLRNFFYGRISKQWSILQHEYLRLHVTTSRQSGASWAAGLLKQIYRWSRSQWDSRNDVVHERDSDAVAVRLLSETDRKIRSEFARGIDGLRASDQYVFYRATEKDMLSKNQTDKESWLRHMASVRKRAHESNVTQMDRMRRFMERWKRKKK